MSEHEDIFGEAMFLLAPDSRVFFPPSYHRPIGRAEAIETDEGVTVRFRYTDPEDAKAMEERIREAREVLRKAALFIATEDQPHDA